MTLPKTITYASEPYDRRAALIEMLEGMKYSKESIDEVRDSGPGFWTAFGHNAAIDTMIEKLRGK